MITWPDLWFPPINLWNVPYQNLTYNSTPIVKTQIGYRTRQHNTRPICCNDACAAATYYNEYNCEQSIENNLSK